jgi:phosphoribosylformylglycinamidine cyclo-ligase
MGCELSGCTLLGGETAELPGFYTPGEYELAGFAVGVVEKSKIIDGKTITAGDRVVGVASSGLHSNGYSLARKIVADQGWSWSATIDGVKLADALIAPTTIYVKPVLALLDRVPVKGLAHITGSGLPGNVPRCLPDGLKAVLHESRWKRPAIFEVLEKHGRVPHDEMFSTFNMGLGLTVVVAPDQVAATLAHFAAHGLDAWDVGEIVAGTPGAEATAVVEP